MDKNYYQRYYGFERTHWWFTAREKILHDYIKNNITKDESLIILNVGCATGRSTEWLMDFGEVVSMEYDLNCIEFTKTKVSFPIDQGSVLELPYSNKKFDLVCAFDVIEHVDNDQLAIQEMARVCKDGGSIFVTVPAHMELWSEHDEVNHHFRRYKIEQLMELFIRAIGNKVFFASYFNYRLYPFVWVFRRVSGWWKTKRKDDGNLKSDFDSFKVGALNKLFYWIMKGESSYLMKQIRQRKGVSIMLHWLNK